MDPRPLKVQKIIQGIKRELYSVKIIIESNDKGSEKKHTEFKVAEVKYVHFLAFFFFPPCNFLFCLVYFNNCFLCLHSASITGPCSDSPGGCWGTWAFLLGHSPLSLVSSGESTTWHMKRYVWVVGYIWDLSILWHYALKAYSEYFCCYYYFYLFIYICIINIHLTNIFIVTPNTKSLPQALPYSNK